MTYKYGLNQPTQALTISCESHSKHQLDEIHQFLTENFKLQDATHFLIPHTKLTKAHPEKDDNFYIALQQLSLCAILAQQLQEYLGIPSFIKPMLLSYARSNTSPQNLKATLLIPLYTYFNPTVITQIYQLAQKIVDLVAQGAECKGQVFKLLSKENLQKLQQAIPGGKSTAPILRAAHQLKIPFFHLGQGIFQLGTGSLAHLIDKSSVDLDTMIGAKISQDKWLTKQLLKQLGYPTPKGQSVRNIEEAKSLFRQWRVPIAIKPQHGDRGEGITLHIQSEDEIPMAFQKAQRYSRLVLMEEMTKGVCHRIGIAHGELLYVTQRNPKFVTGDGIHTITELVEILNQEQLHQPPHLRKILLALDEEAINHLAFQNRSTQDILAINERAYLRPTESTEWGGIYEDYTEKIHPDNRQLAIEITKALRLDVCGLDFMSTDISIPWYENQGKVLEANYSPFMATSSERGRQKLQHFISQIFPQGSRIHHHIFVGDHAAYVAAMERYRQALSEQRSAYIILANETLGPNQEKQQQALGNRFYDRWYSLLLNPQVECVIIHINQDALVDTGLPIDQIESYTIVNTNIESKTKNPDEQVKRCQALIDLLEQHYSEK